MGPKQKREATESLLQREEPMSSSAEPNPVNPHGLSPTTNDEKCSINAMAMVIS
jgi:hypothetical protein